MGEIDHLIAGYSSTYLRLSRLLDRQMTAHGASLARTRILLHLQRQGPSRAIDIADLFGIAPRTVTETIDALERESLLERKPHPTDRRAKLISITVRGKHVIEATEPLRQRLAGSVFGQLNDCDRKNLSAILDKFSAALDGAEINA